MISVAILTVSDSAVAGTRADTSGPKLADRCAQYGWTVAATAVVPDEQEPISRQLVSWADRGRIEVVLTTGGTGVAPRDVTPEATRAILHREIPGLAELMRVRGLAQTQFAVLSRGVAGSRGRTLIVNLPGSPGGAVFSLEAIAHLIPHAVKLLRSETAHHPTSDGSGN